MPGTISWWWAVMAGGTALTMTRAQTTTCLNDTQCTVGFFCETATNFCERCLRCEDLKRVPPAFAVSCIKSVLECGPCLQGLVVDRLSDGDVTHAPCVPPDAGADGEHLHYKWLFIGFVILGVFIVLVMVVIFARRKKDLFRISTATWLRSTCGPEQGASAPDPPPPYNPYSPVRPDSPYNATSVHYLPPHNQQESLPFIKRAPAPLPSGAREADASQNARVYNPPSYVRIDPHSPISPAGDDESSPWPAIHGEDTTPHDWTPDTSTNDDNGNPSGSEVVAVVTEATPSASSSNLPALLAAARETTLVAPPAKKMKTQDNNNNGNRTAPGADGDASAGLGHANDGPSIYFNVQINNTKL